MIVGDSEKKNKLFVILECDPQATLQKDWLIKQYNMKMNMKMGQNKIIIIVPIMI